MIITKEQYTETINKNIMCTCALISSNSDRHVSMFDVVELNSLVTREQQFHYKLLIYQATGVPFRCNASLGWSFLFTFFEHIPAAIQIAVGMDVPTHSFSLKL